MRKLVSARTFGAMVARLAMEVAVDPALDRVDFLDDVDGLIAIQPSFEPGKNLPGRMIRRGTVMFFGIAFKFYDEPGVSSGRPMDEPMSK